MIFADWENPLITFRSIIFQNKWQNPHKFAEIMKEKQGFFGKFHSWGHSNSVFDFLHFCKILVLLCVVHLKEKKMISENWKK